jgi:hypothetical protein
MWSQCGLHIAREREIEIAREKERERERKRRERNVNVPLVLWSSSSCICREMCAGMTAVDDPELCQATFIIELKHLKEN